MSTRSLRVLLLLPLGLTLNLLFASSASGFATVPYIYKTLRDGSVCGSHSTDGGQPYVACRIRFGNVNHMFSHTNWAAAASVAAARWCSILDADHGVADICWVDYTTGGGFDTHGVTVDAANLGGADVNGSVTLGQEQVTSYIDDPNSAYEKTVTALVQVNENAAAPWFVSTSSASSYTVTAGKVDMQTIVVHEFGHAVGLAHPGHMGSSTLPVMYACTGNAYTNFGKTDDGNGDRWLYGGFATKYGSPVNPGVNGCT